MNGWLKLHRQIVQNPMWQHDPTAMHLFLTLLIMADKKTGKYTAGRFQLSELSGIKPTTLYKALQRLELTEMVTQVSNNRFTTISICNYKKYQGVGNTSREQQSNNKVTLNKNKRIKNNTTNVVLETQEYGNPEINRIVDYWNQTTGLPINSQVKRNRNAANTLIKKHGANGVQRLIAGVAMAHNDKYAPRIADLIQLQAKQNELMLWGKQQITKQGVKI